MHSLNGPFGLFLHLLVTQADATHQIVFQAGDHSILPNIPDAKNPGSPAFLSEQGEAVLDGLLGGTVLDLLSMERNGPSLTGHGTKQVL